MISSHYNIVTVFIECLEIALRQRWKIVTFFLKTCIIFVLLKTLLTGICYGLFYLRDVSLKCASEFLCILI